MRRRFPVVAVAGIVALLGMPGAGAVTVENLYTAEVEVSGKGPEPRKKGFQAALERVILRVTGSEDVVARDNVQQLLQQPERFVQQYSYSRLEQERADASAEDDSDGEAITALDDQGGESSGDGEGSSSAQEPKDQPTHRLRVTFAASRLDGALNERDVPVWGRQRPEILVWLAVDDGRQRYIVSADGDSAVRQTLGRAAERRGLPLLLPLMDTADRGRVDFIDIKGGFFDAVRSASARYRAQNMLVGYIERRGGRWHGNWHLLGIGDRRTWQTESATRDAVVVAGVAGSTERIAAAFAGREGEIQPVHLRIHGIGDISAYARVASYLEGLARVQLAEVVEVRPGQALFRVETKGRVAQLERAIALGDTLRPQARSRESGAVQSAGVQQEPTSTSTGARSGSGGDGSTDTGGLDASAMGGSRMPARQRAPVPELVYRLDG